jgi:ATP-binding cassette, subfamily B, bacterial
MIDFGFTADSVTMINSYFSLMIAVVAVLALASASRLYLVTRSLLTAIVIFLVFSSIVAMLWVGSHDVMNGQITAGRLCQFLLYAALAAGALSELSQVWGDVSAASGASERLFEILRLKPAIAAPASPSALPTPSRGDVKFGNVRFLPGPARMSWTAFRLR